ncbi:MAG: ATP-binding protein [Proteobacteria bacterium]|nr:ATP-binding protein [Pseudomonadota bacterium]
MLIDGVTEEWFDQNSIQLYFGQMERYLQKLIQSDALASHKIAFLSGPRQVGKTSLSKQILGGGPGYFTWDDDEFKKLWIQNPKRIFENHGRVVLDEIHKDRSWKNRLKGLFDLYSEGTRILVTGSAHLDFYPKSGDSLQGRYFPYRLHPISLNERSFVPEPPSGKDWGGELDTRFHIEDLLSLGGFPEPFLGQNDQKARRWRRLHRERMIREDLRDLREVKDLEKVRVLSLLLEEKVSGTLSYQSLREDVGGSFESVKSWVDALEALFFCFRIKPWSKGVKRSLLKEPKVYLYDWAVIEEPGARFENLIASHLLKSCQAWSDAAMGDFELGYLRDKQKREVDFIITRNKKPWALVEAKTQGANPSPSLLYFTQILKPEFSIQVVRNPKKERRASLHSNVQVLDVRRFLSRLV